MTGIQHTDAIARASLDLKSVCECLSSAIVDEIVCRGFGVGLSRREASSITSVRERASLDSISSEDGGSEVVVLALVSEYSMCMADLKYGSGFNERY
jgi:hypothetical protein